MSTPAETRTRRSRHKILAAAEACFLGTGYLGTSMDQVATAAGVSKQTVYSNFGSKEALFLEVIRAMTDSAAGRLKADAGNPAADPPLETFLFEFALQQLSIVLTPRLLQLRRLVIAEAERFPELGRALHRQGPARSIGRLTKAFERYAARGALNAPDLTTAATHFNWIVMGAPVNDAMFLGDAGIPSRSRLRKHAQESVRIFLAAFANERPDHRRQ